MLFPKAFDISPAVTILTLRKHKYMSEAWFVRTIEIEIVWTNRTENSSINISEFDRFNPSLALMRFVFRQLKPFHLRDHSSITSTCF